MYPHHRQAATCLRRHRDGPGRRQPTPISGRGRAVQKLTACVALLCFALSADQAAGQTGAAPAVSNWSFEDGVMTTARESVTGRDSRVVGFAHRAPGASGRALWLDGYTTAVECPIEDAPGLREAATFEAWVALQAYPWGLCGLINHADEQPVELPADEGMINVAGGDPSLQPDPTAGYLFGLDGDGRVHLQLSLQGRWVTCRSEAGIPLLQWTHVAATFDASAKVITVYINGQAAATTSVEGTLDFAAEADLLIGRNHEARAHDRPIRMSPPALYGIEGYLDEVRIYDRALSADEIRERFASFNPPRDSGLQPDTLPEIPTAPGGFGAYTTRLKFTRPWDELRRDGSHSDVVVLFDDLPWKYVFWRGTNYIPHWVTENGIWYTNEFNETWGHGALGCAEPMSDKQTRFSRVSILENSPARVVVHWRYALTDTRYIFARTDPINGWGDWSDEYHIIYPDGIGVRKICLWSSQPGEPHEFQESIVLIPAGRRPEDVIETEAVTMVNMRGEIRDYSWATQTPARIDQPAHANIEIVNVRSEARPFLVVSDESFELGGEAYAGPLFRPMKVEIEREASIFPWWNHWPVAQIPSDGRWARYADRIAHSSLTTGLEWKDWETTPNSRTRIMLHGLTELPPARVSGIARSWLRAPDLHQLTPGTLSRGYDPSERAYILDASAGDHDAGIHFELLASSEHPLHNPAFVIRGWGNRPVRVHLNGAAHPDGADLRIGHRRTLDSTDLIVWIRLEVTRPVRFGFTP